MTLPFSRHASVNTVKVTVYLPDRDKFGFPIDADHWVAQFARLFATLAGGATIHPLAQGVWLEEDLLISESVRTVVCFMPQALLDSYATALYALVQDFAQETQQSTVGVEIDGTFYIVPTLSKETHLC